MEQNGRSRIKRTGWTGKMPGIFLMALFLSAGQAWWLPPQAQGAQDAGAMENTPESADAGAFEAQETQGGVWEQSESGWHYYVNGGMARDQWVKYRDDWYFLDGAGLMAAGRLIEYRNEIYYVDDSGKMAANEWVSLANEEGERPEVWWYYFQADGSAVRGKDNNKVSPRTVNEKKYAFDSQGRMLSGWVRWDDASVMAEDEDAWMEGDYYFGDENDGAMTLGWRQINIVDSQADEEEQYWLSPGFTETEDQLRYFYFKPNGKKLKGAEADNGFVRVKQEYINGMYYGFDQYGRMLAEWSSDQAGALGALPRISAASSSAAWRNFNSVESGQRYTEGWFKVAPAQRLDPGDYDDGAEGWYYADDIGHILAGKFKYIGGARYGFDQEGRMTDGMKMIGAEGSRIRDVVSDDHMEDLPFETGGEFDHNAGYYTAMGYGFYYFGEEDDGIMRTGAHSLRFREWDPNEYPFYLNETGRGKGAGYTGRRDDKLYNAGKRMEADPYQKYQAVVNVNADIKPGGVVDIESIWADGGDGAYIGYYRLEDAEALKRGIMDGNGDISMDNDGRELTACADEGSITLIPVTAEMLGQPGAMLMDNGFSTGITVGEFRKAAGLTLDPDQYAEVTAYLSARPGNGGSGSLVYSLGLPSDLVYIVNSGGRIQEKDKRVKDKDNVYFKMKGSRLVATYIRN